MTAVDDRVAAAIVAARLSSHESQVVFRRVLDALARPGRMTWLPADTARRVPPALVPLLALCDLEVTHCVVGPARDGREVNWGEVVTAATGSREAELSKASWICAFQPLGIPEIERIERGSAQAPERGARLVQACHELHMGEGDQPWSSTEPGASIITIELRGPGIPDRRRVTVSGVDPQLFDALAHTNRTFPAGVDCWLVAESGAVMGLPRTTTVTTLHHTTRGVH